MSTFTAIGLDASAEDLYRRVLRDQGHTPDVYAARLNVPVHIVETAAEQLRAQRLVRIDERGVLRADHPRASLERILSIEEAKLATRRRDLARLRDAIDSFAGDHRAGQEAASAERPQREYLDAQNLVDVMEHLAASTSGPIRVTHPQLAGQGPDDQPVLRRLVEEGRELLGLYEFETVQMHSLEIAQWGQSGEQQRLASHVPSEFVCYGQDAVLASTEWGGSDGRYVVLRDAVVVRAFVELFDRLWTAGAGLDEAVSGSSEQLVDLMQAGLKDEAIARVLGVSLRTVRRRVAALMDECGVDTRFQLAVALTERGLVGSGERTDGLFGG